MYKLRFIAVLVNAWLIYINGQKIRDTFYFSIQRVVGPKGRWSEGLLVRRVVGPKGHCSEKSLLRRVFGPKSVTIIMSLLFKQFYRYFLFCAWLFKKGEHFLTDKVYYKKGCLLEYCSNFRHFFS